MKKLLLIASMLLVTSIGYAQVDCTGLNEADCEDAKKHEKLLVEDRENDLKEIRKELTKRRSASTWSKINKCNVDAEKLLLQISRLVRGSDGWIDQVDKLYLRYSNCLRKAQPKTTVPGGADEGEKGTAF
ncbi:hypothetical protein [Maribacter algarum]|nr:hypothetical protein [Maribacter algarum]